VRVALEGVVYLSSNARVALRRAGPDEEAH
jgi:hypothetical protein